MGIKDARLERYITCLLINELERINSELQLDLEEPLKRKLKRSYRTILSLTHQLIFKPDAFI